MLQYKRPRVAASIATSISIAIETPADTGAITAGVSMAIAATLFITRTTGRSRFEKMGAYPVEEWMVARFVIPAALLGRNPASCADCLVQKHWIPAKNLPE